MPPADLINHLSARARLEAFVQDVEQQLFIVHAPSNFGKSVLGSWFYERCCQEFATVHLEFLSGAKPPELLKEILDRLEIERGRCTRMQQCPHPTQNATSVVQGVTLQTSSNISIVAAAPSDEASLNFYYSELFDAFMGDMAEHANDCRLVLIVDNMERGDPNTAKWLKTNLFKLCQRFIGIKIVVFAREHNPEALHIEIRRRHGSLRLQAIENKEEIYQYIRARGRRVTAQVRGQIDRAMKVYRDEPSSLAIAVKVL